MHFREINPPPRKSVAGFDVWNPITSHIDNEWLSLMLRAVLNKWSIYDLCSGFISSNDIEHLCLSLRYASIYCSLKSNDCAQQQLVSKRGNYTFDFLNIFYQWAIINKLNIGTANQLGEDCLKYELDLSNIGATTEPYCWFKRESSPPDASTFFLNPS